MIPDSGFLVLGLPNRTANHIGVAVRAQLCLQYGSAKGKVADIQTYTVTHSNDHCLWETLPSSSSGTREEHLHQTCALHEPVLFQPFFSTTSFLELTVYFCRGSLGKQKYDHNALRILEYCRHLGNFTVRSDHKNIEKFAKRYG